MTKIYGFISNLTYKRLKLTTGYRTVYPVRFEKKNQINEELKVRFFIFSVNLLC